MNPANRIVVIDGPWDEFARSNGAAGLTRQSVLGTSLFEHVAGPEAEQVVSLLLNRARSGRGVVIDFRCDSPSLRRFMRLDMRARADGDVRCESTVEREEPRPPQALLDPTVVRSAEILTVCGWCKQVQIGDDRWTEVEHAVGILKLFDRPALPRLSHGICGRCLDAVQRDVEARSDGPVGPSA